MDTGTCARPHLGNLSIRRLQSSLLLAATVAAIMFGASLPNPLAACIHLPDGYENSFDSQSQQTIIYHDGKLETLIVKVESPSAEAGTQTLGRRSARDRNVDILGVPSTSNPSARRSGGRVSRTGGPGDEAPPRPPASLAAIIPVPAKGAHIDLNILQLASLSATAEENARLCSQLFKDLKSLTTPVPRDAEPTPRSGPIFTEEVYGPYGITQFDNTPAGIAALNAWITARTVSTAAGAVNSMPIKGLDTDLPAFRYYLKGDWTFCAVRVVDFTKPAVPLKIEFPSNVLFYPIKLTAAGSEASLNRQGKYTVYTLLPASVDASPLIEEMALHKFTAYGIFDGTREVPVTLGELELEDKEALPKLIEKLGLKAGDTKVLRFEGSFLGREARRFEADVFAGPGTAQR